MDFKTYYKKCGYIYGLALLVVVCLTLFVLTGCNKKYPCTFDQELENVVSVEIMAYDYDTRSATTVITLDEEIATSLLYDLSNINYGDRYPPSGGAYGEIILYITYQNGEAEVIGYLDQASVDNNGKWWGKGHYIDFFDWYNLIYKYVDRETVPQLEEWYQHIMSFDQETNKNDLIKRKYTIKQIEELKSTAETERILFSKFREDFRPHCVRRTHQGFYVVLLLKDGRDAFVFFNKENTVVDILVSDGFKSKTEFQNQIAEQMTKSEVMNFDSNTLAVAVSGVEITAHIVQEGIFIVKYSRILDGKTLDDPIVTSFEFIENDDISINEDSFVRDEIPFIFELDKISE